MDFEAAAGVRVLGQTPPTTTRGAIQANALTKRYGKSLAVDRLDLAVGRGELFGFLGPNGSGKTTTIRMMTGLLEPTSGSVSIAGIDVWSDPLAAKARFAYVPDEPNLFPKLTAWEYLRFIASVFQMPPETYRQRASELLQVFDIADRADELIESYSHGMRQKIALAGALLHLPEVIFLDEPTVGLDPPSARTLKALLRRVCDSGTTVFLTTHILEIAESMCDRIAIIKSGQIIALGTIDELRRQRGDGNERQSLEDLFIELTGASEDTALIDALASGDERHARHTR